MRKQIVAGNWKMNTNISEGMSLALNLRELSTNFDNNTEVVVIPPFTHIIEIKNIFSDTNVKIGAQNCASEENGAFTGEVSAEMIKSMDAKYTIVGHSERRAYYHETNDLLNKKVKLCLKNSLTPIYCCGENLDERQSEKHFDIVKSQISEGLFTLSKEDFSKLVIAYEPVWAIGTGVTASPDQAQEIHKYIRSLITQKYGDEIAKNTSLLYGGSVKPNNANEIFGNPDVDGGLIGGAALKAEDFMGIINAF
jgi:triosephosphate isomerase